MFNSIDNIFSNTDDDINNNIYEIYDIVTRKSKLSFSDIFIHCNIVRLIKQKWILLMNLINKKIKKIIKSINWKKQLGNKIMFIIKIIIFYLFL